MTKESEGYQIISEVDAKSIYELNVEIEERRKHNDYVDDVYIDDIDDDTGDDIDDGTQELSTPVRLDFNRMFIRRILCLTCNFSKDDVQVRGSSHADRLRSGLFYTLQLVFIGFLCLYIAFTFGWIRFGKQKTVITANSKFVFTKAYDIIWELKWFISCVIGMLYCRSGHLQYFLRHLTISKGLWKRTIRYGVLYICFVLLIVIVAPVGFHSLQFYYQHQDWSQMLVSSAFYMLFRLITAPSFCIVTAVLYLVKLQIDLLGRTLQGLPFALGLPYALREIRAVKMIIRKVDVRLKYYLLIHILLILFTTFTGIFSLIERIQFRVREVNANLTLTEIREIVPATQDNMNTMLPYKRIEELKGTLTNANSLRISLEQSTQQNGNTSQADGQTEKNVLTRKLDYLAFAALENAQRISEMNTFSKNRTFKLTSKSSASKSLVVFLQNSEHARVMFESFFELLEVIILFVLPLILLNWHRRAIKRITDVIYDLDIEDQRRNGLLIQDKGTKDELIDNLESMRGVTIFGMEVNFFRTVFLALLAPFLTVILKALFSHYSLTYK